MGLSKHSPESSARELRLGDEPARAALRDEWTEVRRVAARGQHDPRSASVPGQPGSDFEPVEVGELDVEEHDVGSQLLALSRPDAPFSASPTTSKPSA